MYSLGNGFGGRAGGGGYRGMAVLVGSGLGHAEV
jgi:hypothetical protein